MAWWMWIGLVLVAAVLVFTLALRSFRRRVRGLVLEALREGHPELQVVRELNAAIEVRLADGVSATLWLSNLYQTVAQGSHDEAAQRAVVRGFVTSFLASTQEAARPLSLAADGDRLMPRLADASLALQAAAQGTPLIQRETPVAGLLVLYVLDSESSVRYLGQEQLDQLGIDAAALHARAIANLARHPIDAIVRDVLEHGNVALVKLGGSYDATRLLLVPELLKEGEELAAVIPDRDTLALMPVPSGDGWSPVRKLARTPASPYLLLDRPLRVTRAGFEVA